LGLLTQAFASDNRGLKMQTTTFMPNHLTHEQKAELLALFSLKPAELKAITSNNLST
jgi:hypothetical protein